MHTCTVCQGFSYLFENGEKEWMGEYAPQGKGNDEAHKLHVATDVITRGAR